MGDDDGLKLETTQSTTTDQATSSSYRIAAHGEIDMASAPTLQSALDTLIDEGATLVILDASGVHFMDSSGLRVIIGCGDRLAEGGGRLLIEGMSGAVQRVLELSGILERYKS